MDPKQRQFIERRLAEVEDLLLGAESKVGASDRMEHEYQGELLKWALLVLEHIVPALDGDLSYDREAIYGDNPIGDSYEPEK